MANSNRRISQSPSREDGRQPSAGTRRGATGSTTSIRDRLSGLVRHHLQLAHVTTKRLLREPMQTLMTSLVVAIALGLPAFFYLAVVNLQSVGDAIDVNGQITVFLKQGVTEKQVEALSNQLAEMEAVGGLSYISPEQALAEFRQRSGFGEVLELLDQNPLPGVLTVLPSDQLATDVAAVNALLQQIQAMSAVDDVMLDMHWLERLNMFLLIAERLTISLGLALALGVLLIVGNTIRLEIENRKSEIVVVKLVGGTNAFVRRPFLYTGVWYGIVGGLLAWLLVGVVFLSIQGSVQHLAGLYESSFVLEGAGFLSLLVLIGLGAALGLIGAFIAVANHLSAIEPS